MAKQYRVIIFDLGNTLIRFDHNISAGKFSRLFNLDAEKTRAMFFDSDLTRDFERGAMPPREFHRRMTRRLGIRLSFADFAPIWNDIFWEDRDACDIARKLKESYRLFLLSNVSRLHYEYIAEKFDIIGIFDEVILSFAVGAIKPEARIFDDALERAGGDRSRVLYIDDREDLVSEANRLGIESIRFENSVKLKEELLKRGIST